MASIRRGASSSAAANDHQSQSLYFLFTSSSSSTTPTSPITTASPSRKWASSSSHHHFSSFFNWWWDCCKWWKKKKKKRFVLLLLRIFFFFLLGFFLGFSPFAHLFYLHDDDVAHFKPHHFFFNSIPTTTTPPIFLHCNNSQQQRQQQQQSSSLVSVDHLQESDFDLRHDKDDLDLVHLHRPIIPQKLLIIVTPTYNRALQAYYLTRLAHTLSLVPPPLLWIVVEMDSASSETANILRRMGVLYRHLVCDKSSNNVKDRGVHQRNTALDHIERHRLDGIVYFADDDNIYSLHLFHHLRSIRKFGTWPVAMLAQNKNKATLEGPVCNGSQVVGWHTNEKSKRLRRFHVDMSGFAFNTTILWDVKRRWRPTSLAIRQLDTVKEGFQETTFIEQVVEDESQMESVPRDCSRIMNWHLHLEARHLVYPKACIRFLHAIPRDVDFSSQKHPPLPSPYHLKKESKQHCLSSYFNFVCFHWGELSSMFRLIQDTCSYCG